MDRWQEVCCEDGECVVAVLKSEVMRRSALRLQRHSALEIALKIALDI